MRRASGFGRSLAFAALAAAGLLVAHPLLAPLLGASATARLYLLGSVAVYVGGLGADAGRRRAAAALALGLGAAAWWLPLGIAGTAVAAAAILGGCRSGLLYRARPLRAGVAEALLLSAGLALAHFLASGSLASLAFAVWGFFLVQSAFFWIGGVRLRRDGGPRDPFDRARAELLALLR